MGVTPVENMFINQYLPGAPGDYVRVYLYGLMLCYHPGEDMSLEKMGRMLNLDADAVKDAFQYWERQGLVRRVSDVTPAYEYLNIASSMGDESPMDRLIYLHRDFNNRLQQIISAGSDKVRLLHPAEFQIACEWVEDLGLTEDVVAEMVSYYVKNRKKAFKFKDYDKLAMEWAEKGVATVEEARQMLMKDSEGYKTAKKALEQLGLRRSPTQPEIDLAVKWLVEWGLDEDAILAACQETVKGRNPTLSYLDSILSRNRAAKTGAAMAETLSADDGERAAVKALHAALGIAQMSPTDKEREDYRDILGIGFEPEAVLRVAKSMGLEGRYSMDDLNRQLMRFAEKGLLSDMQVAEYLDQQKLLKEQAARVFEKAGQDSRVNAAAAAQMEEWLSLAAFPLVLYAAECARGTRTPSKYITKLLASWRAAGVASVDEAKRRMPPPASASNQGGAAYEMRSYSEDELNALLVDPAQYLKEHRP